MPKNKILITGTSGFVGSRFLDLYPKKKDILPVSLQSTAIKDIDFSRVGTVLHCAGIAHRMEGEDEDLYFSVNRDLTLELAKKAKAAGVKQLIFLSTIKVYGKDSSTSPITISTPCVPTDAYGQSKWEAEKGLREMSDDAFKVSILRLPLLYGPGVKGNLLRLMQALHGGKAVPLGGISNQRSMLCVDNLVALLQLLIASPFNGVLQPADEPAVSTSDLTKALAEVINPQKNLWTLPSPVWQLIRLIKPAFYQRLYCSLIVEPSYGDLEFKPRISVSDGLRTMVEDFMNNRSTN